MRTKSKQAKQAFHNKASLSRTVAAGDKAQQQQHDQTILVKALKAGSEPGDKARQQQHDQTILVKALKAASRVTSADDQSRQGQGGGQGARREDLEDKEQGSQGGGSRVTRSSRHKQQQPTTRPSAACCVLRAACCVLRALRQQRSRALARSRWLVGAGGIEAAC
jgi:hypothetical protein